MNIQQMLLLTCIAMLTGCVWLMQRKYDQISKRYAKQIKALAEQQYHTSKLLIRLVKENKELKNNLQHE